MLNRIRHIFERVQNALAKISQILKISQSLSFLNFPSIALLCNLERSVGVRLLVYVRRPRLGGRNWWKAISATGGRGRPCLSVDAQRATELDLLSGVNL